MLSKLCLKSNETCIFIFQVSNIDWSKYQQINADLEHTLEGGVFIV